MKPTGKKQNICRRKQAESEVVKVFHRHKNKFSIHVELAAHHVNYFSQILRDRGNKKDLSLDR